MSTVNTIRLLTAYLKKPFLVLRDRDFTLNFMMVIWPHKIVLCFFEPSAGPPLLLHLGDCDGADSFRWLSFSFWFTVDMVITISLLLMGNICSFCSSPHSARRGCNSFSLLLKYISTATMSCMLPIYWECTLYALWFNMNIKDRQFSSEKKPILDQFCPFFK